MTTSRLFAFVLILLLPLFAIAQTPSRPRSNRPISTEFRLMPVPATLSSIGKPGDFAIDEDYLYVYIGTGDPPHSWERIPIAGGGGGGAVESVAGKTGEVELEMADITDAGNSATRDVGTGSGDVSAGNHNHSGVYDPAGTGATQAAAAVSTHEGTYAHANLPSANEKAGLAVNSPTAGNPVLTAANVGTIAGLSLPGYTDLAADTSLPRREAPYQHYYKALSGNLTLTDDAGTPTADHGQVVTYFGHASNSYTVQIPTSYSEVNGQNVGTSQNVATFTVPANSQITLTRRYINGGWVVYGFPDFREVALPPVSFDPVASYTLTNHRVPVMTVDATLYPSGFRVTRWRFSFDADPTAELTADLKRADAYVGVANSAVMDALDTTAGVSSESTASNINSGNAVAAGKVIYFEHDGSYAEAGHFVTLELYGYRVP